MIISAQVTFKKHQAEPSYIEGMRDVVSRCLWQPTYYSDGSPSGKVVGYEMIDGNLFMKIARPDPS